MVWPGASPRWAVPMPQGTWAYSTGDDLDQCSRGVYRESSDGTAWNRMAPLPYVLERLIRRVNGNRRDATYYRLAMSPDDDSSNVVICDEDEIRTGLWASKLDVALSPSRQIIDGAAAAILDTAREHAESRELAPRTQGDELQLPPPDVGPAGYGQTAPGEQHARDCWAEIAKIAARTPRLALTLGVSLGGLYIGPLRRQPFFWFLVGDGGKGKTTALRAAAAMYGPPETGQVLRPWNTTPVGLVQELGLLSILPAFRDELGAGKFRTSTDLENLVLSVAQGGNRGQGGKSGIPKASETWRSVLVSSGNDSILGRVTNEGAARRLIEIETPITNNAADSELLGTDDKPGLVDECYGWPLHWLYAHGLDVEGFGHLITTAEDDLPLPSGAVPRGLGRHLALAVAGAARLEEMTGVTGVRDTALAEARELLARQVAEIREHGLTPAQRVLNAVREAQASRPAAYPTREKYRELRGNDFGLPREVEGWDLRGDRAPGDLAVMTGKLEAICQARDITNSRTGLRSLASQGLLVRGDDKEGRLRRNLYVCHEKHDVYVFTFPDDEGESPGDNGTGDTEPSNTVTPQHRDTGDTANGADRSDGGEQQQITDEHSDAEHVVTTGHAGPVRHIPGQTGLICRVCAAGSPPFADDLGAVHPMCATGKAAPSPVEQETEARSQPERRETSGDPSPARERRSQPRRGQRRLAPCGVLDADGLWLPDADAPAAVQPPADIGAAYRLALSNDLRQLWIHPNAHEQLGIPATREITADVGQATSVPHEWATVEGLTVDSGRDTTGERTPGLAAWVNVQRGKERRVGIVFPAYDVERTEWHTASDGRTLRDAVLRFAAVTGTEYYMSPNETSYAMLSRSTAGKPLTSFASADELPHPMRAGRTVEHLSEDSRPLLDEEDGQEWTHSYDRNAAELSVNTSVYIGVGEPERIELTEFHGKEWRQTAGYVLANVPRTHPALDPRLPNLLYPWTRADERSETPGGPTWVPVELLVYLDELGVPIEPSEALYWPDSRRALRGYGEKLSHAYSTLKATAQDSEADALALAVLKDMGKSRIGDFNRASSRLYRPDIRDMIKTKAITSGYRSLRKIAAQTGRYPIAWYVDAALYTSDDPDPTTASPVDFGPGMGQWKPEPDKSLRLVQVREHLGERGFAGRLERIRNGRK